MQSLKTCSLTCRKMHQRKHIRLREFDYSSVSAYFITICTKNFTHHFGKISNGFMCLNEIGNTAYNKMISISDSRNLVSVDEVIVMPNHIHCLFDIKRKVLELEITNQFSRPICDSISMIVNQYKGEVKKWCNKNGYSNFEWQTRFYDHVIRDNRAYGAIKDYIINNPRKWMEDRYRDK